MSSLEAKKITPATGTTVTLGAAGDAVTVAATALKTNTIKDAGGNTLFTSDGSGTLSSVNSGFNGGLTFISSQTATGASSVDFTSGIDSTYNEYVFVFTAINPVNDATSWRLNASTDSGSNWNVLKTTTVFKAIHDENNVTASIAYFPGDDTASGTGYQDLAYPLGNGADECAAGILHIFVPSSTTYVKNFYSTFNIYGANNDSRNAFVAGYFNTTSAINGISFKTGGGNINAGTIAMYGTG